MVVRRFLKERSLGKKLWPNQYVCLGPCDNDRCVDPDHSVVMSKSQYLRKAIPSRPIDVRLRIALAKRASGASKLKTIEEARRVRQMHAAGATAIDLARQFGMSVERMSKLLRGKSYVDPQAIR